MESVLIKVVDGNRKICAVLVNYRGIENTVAYWLRNGYTMIVSAITVKNIPDDLIAGLKARAAAAHRSLNGEILYRLRRSLEIGGTEEVGVLREETAIQADAWEKMSGRWVSDLSPEEEIEALYSARSAARDVDLTW